MTDTKTKKVTFDTGLPRGTCATFTHEGQLWIAYPLEKNKRILAVIDRLLGIHAKMTKDAIRWLNAHPDQTEAVLMLLTAAARAQQICDEMTVEKVEAVTM